MVMRVRLNFLLCRMKDIFDAGNVEENNGGNEHSEYLMMLIGKTLLIFVMLIDDEGIIDVTLLTISFSNG
jgi:hypothetical protein